MEKVFIVLENGQVFAGRPFGARVGAVGELVFTTGMTGYVETLTDPGYCGQIVLQTFPLIGNYGIIPEDFESSAPALSAYVVREYCEQPSNFRNQMTLDEFLKQNNIPGVYGVDTRSLTRVIRENGTMNAVITDEAGIESAAARMREHKPQNAVQSVTCKQPVHIEREDAKFKVAVWDFGCRQSLTEKLLARGCSVVRVPAHYTAQQIKALNAYGLMLSGGPGDPSANSDIIAELKRLTGHLPIFGIDLGHQLLALAHGARTHKLKYGHRGANQPVRDTQTGRIYTTAQSHGYAVAADTLPGGTAFESFVNVNDGTCEGVQYLNSPTLSVQFFPDEGGGPHSTEFLFDKFLSVMEEFKVCR